MLQRKNYNWSAVLPIVVCLMALVSADDRIYDMDRLSTCGQRITVFDQDLVLNGKSKVAPANPPTECTVFLESGYTESDGKYRLQIIVEAINILDCKVFLAVFNGKGAGGSFLRNMGCGSMSTDTMYSSNREVTIRLTRPFILYQTYSFTLRIRTYRDKDEGGYFFGTNRLSPGAIVGIIIGIIALIVIAVLLGWCYKSGKLAYYPGRTVNDAESVEKVESVGVDNDIAVSGKTNSIASGLDYRDPVVWNTITTGQYTPQQGKKLGRNFYQQKSANNRISHLQNNYDNEAYEKYAFTKEDSVKLNTAQNSTAYAEWRRNGNADRMFESGGDKRASTGSTSSQNRRQGNQRAAYSDSVNTGKKPYENVTSPLNREEETRGSRRSTGSKRASFVEVENQQNMAKESPAVKKRRSYADKASSDESEETLIKRTPSGLFENPDAEGYIYDYDHVQSLSDVSARSVPGEGSAETARGKPGYNAFVRDVPGESTLRSSDRESTRGSKRGPKHSEKLPPGSSAASGGTKTVPEATIAAPSRHHPGSPSEDIDTPELGDQDYQSPHMKRYLSIDLQSEPESDRMSNPVHVNAAVRATVPDKKDGSPSVKKRKKKPGKHKGQPCSDAPSESVLPPEAFEPVFTTPVSEHPYDQQPQGMPYGSYGVPGYDGNLYPNNPYAPYGMIPISAFGPMPGQTVAYAYQTTGPPGSAPDQPVAVTGQAAWYVQSTPSKEGPVKKAAFMMTTSSPHHHPSKHESPRRGGHGGLPDDDDMNGVYPGTPDFTSTPAGTLTPHRGKSGKPRSQRAPDPVDMSILAAGAVPPDPGPGNRSAMMRSGIDPKSGMQTTQITWRDNLPDPTDPPGPNPQVTRKTITRVTTRSGHGDLPENQNPSFSGLSNSYADRVQIEPDEPAFLAPSATRSDYTPQPHAISSSREPETDNVAFYLGRRHPGAPEPIIHEAPSRSRAFRDQITFGDSHA